MKDQITPEDQEAFYALLNEGVLQGLDGGIRLFLQKHQLKTEKGATGLDTHWIFAQHIIAEWPTLGKDGEAVNSSYAYPLKESIKAPVDKLLEENAQTLGILFFSEERETMLKLVRVIISGAVVEVLNRNKDDAIAFHEGLKAKK